MELQRSVISVPGWLPKDSGLVLTQLPLPQRGSVLVLTPLSQYLVGRKIRRIKPLHEMLRWCRAEVAGVQVTGVLLML